MSAVSFTQPLSDDTEQRLLWKIARGLSPGAGFPGMQIQGAVSGGGPLAPLPAVQFSYEPATTIISWDDAGGPKNGDLATFYATADIPSVTAIYCSASSITSISNLFTLPLLGRLDCDDNLLNSLDLSGCASLVTLNCQENNISSLDVSFNPDLVSLTCWGCGLSTLSITLNPLLTYLDAHTNGLTSANVDQILSDLDSGGLLGGFVDLSGQAPPAPPGAIGYTAITNLLAKGWTVLVDPAQVLWAPATEVASWVDSGGPHLGDLAAFLATADFGTVSQLTFGATGLLTSLTGLQDLPALSVVDVNNNALAALDVTGCAGLTFLDCSLNLLTGLDVTACILLALLNCSDNSVMTLDVTNCTALVALGCNGCSLTAIDVSNCPGLLSLDVSNNAIAILDVTVCASLSSLYCVNNLLIALDVTGCPLLMTLYGYGNLLATLDLSLCTLMADLDVSDNLLTALDVTACTALLNLACSTNAITTIDVSLATGIGALVALDNSMPMPGVDTVLSSVVTANLAGAGLVDLRGTNFPPTDGVQNADKILLEANGWTIRVNTGWVLDDGTPGYWILVVDVLGNVGATSQPVSGLPTPIVLDDGTATYWAVTVDNLGNLGTVPDAGPATTPPTLCDANGVIWTLVVDTMGNLGATV